MEKLAIDESKDPDLDPDSDGVELSKKEKLILTLKSLSVEPAGLLLIISIIVSHLIFANLLMETICRVDLGYEEMQCKEIILKVNISNKAIEREIQKVQAGIQAFTSVIFSSMTILIVLFVGPWSDENGRKIPLLLSVSGLVCFNVIMLVCHALLGKVNGTVLTLLAMFPISVTGGGVVFGMSAYSYICDTTSNKNRTVRTGILSGALRSGLPIGFALGGGLTKIGVGVQTSLFICVGLSIVAILIIVFGVKNTKPPKKDDDDEPTKKRSKWIRYNPIMKLWQAFAILIKERPNRRTFWLLIICYLCYAAPGSGEHSMLYLFVRERLQWNMSDYGFFSMFNWFMSAIGVVLAMFVLSKILKVRDPIVGFIAGISQIAGSTMYAFTTSALMMYMASATDLLNGTMGVVSRSMLSKTVDPDEVGKLFGMLGVLDSLLPLAMVPAYALTYRNTNTTFAGAFFFISVGVTVPAELIFLYFICRGDKADKETVQSNGVNKPHNEEEGTQENLLENARP